MDYWYKKVQEKRSPKYKMSVRLVGACHIALDEACPGAYPGVGAFHSPGQNSYLGAYPEWALTRDTLNATTTRRLQVQIENS